ncbi:cytochrome d ubiquinol oxidase subunit II [Marinicella sp. W31]|uniref:cytochrome d ubiquinol oxidase subunit II n=1 Tax=Marinicella sp. W31 TaxID=3023713 RepID=UPI003757D153
MDYALIWAGLLAFAVFAYVILDGFDLGIGILFPWIKDPTDKGTAMNSIAPIWDGNETWLVLGGGGLYAVFPLAYAVIMPALYAPLIVMLLALIFRGVAFEFRWRAETPQKQKLWDIGFTAGSVAAAFSQGIALGALVKGIHVVDRSYAGGWWDWLSPFSLTTGVALVIGYAALGSGWLILKTTGTLQNFAFRVALGLTLGISLMIGAISLWMTYSDPSYMTRWFNYPNYLYLAPIPILVAVFTLKALHAIIHRKELQPFLLMIGLFALSYFGLCLSFYPNIVPPEITIWAAAGPDNSLKFLLVGAAVLLPMIIAYTAYSYWVFRGKVKADEAYH